jgi:hypothetical protein
MPSSLGGFAEGFLGRVDQYRNEEREDELRRTQREGQILSLLLEHGKPDVQALALQGLLDQANPKMRKKGLAGFLGQYQTGPAAGQLLSLLQTPERVERQVPTGPPTLETQAAPVSDPSGMVPLPQMQLTPPPTRTEVSYQPRQAIYSPEERYAQQARGQAQGDVEGEVAGLVASGFTPEQARMLVQKRYERLYRTGSGLGAQTYAEGEIVFNPNTQQWEQILYRRDDPNQQVRMPAMPKSARSTRAANPRELIAKELYGDPNNPNEDARDLLQRLSPEQIGVVDDEVRARDIEEAGQRTRRVGDEEVVTTRNRELVKPIGVTHGAEQGLPPTTPLGEMAGVTPITDQQRARLESAKAITGTLYTAPGVDTSNPGNLGLKDLVAAVFPRGTGLVGGLTASAQLMAKRAARDPHYAALEARIQLALGNVSRVLAAESGRLTEPDAQRARAALVNLQSGLLNGDTYESAMARIAVIEDALVKINRDIQTPAQQMKNRGKGGPPAKQTGPPGPAGAAAAPQTGPYPVGSVQQHQSGRKFKVLGYTPDGKIIPEWVQ